MRGGRAGRRPGCGESRMQWREARGSLASPPTLSGCCPCASCTSSLRLACTALSARLSCHPQTPASPHHQQWPRHNRNGTAQLPPTSHGMPPWSNYRTQAVKHCGQAEARKRPKARNHGSNRDGVRRKPSTVELPMRDTRQELPLRGSLQGLLMLDTRQGLHCGTPPGPPLV